MNIEFDYLELRTDRGLQQTMKTSYAENGFVLVRNLANSKRVGEVENFAHSVAQSIHNKGRRYANRVNLHHQHPFLMEFAKEPSIVFCAQLLTQQPLDIIGTQLMFRAPGSVGTPSHQDNYFIKATPKGDQILCWFAIDEAQPENGSLYVYPGSHLGPILRVKKNWANIFQMGTQFANDFTNKFARSKQKRDQSEPMIHFLETRVPRDRYQKVTLTVPAGAGLLVHGNTIHGSGDNRSDRFRKTVGISFLSPTAKFRRGLVHRRKRVSIQE